MSIMVEWFLNKGGDWVKLEERFVNIVDCRTDPKYRYCNIDEQSMLKILHISCKHLT